jgi:hypothetical protein
MATVADLYFLGLDLGQSMDPSALVALRREISSFDSARTGRNVYRYIVRGIRRWPLGTLYPVVVNDVTDVVSRPPLAGCVLGVDRTGCGAPVVDMLRERRPQAQIKPIVITSGHAVGGDAVCFHVPKRELVGVVNVLLQSGRLEIPVSLPDAMVLMKELQTFRAKITAAGNESFEADWREKAHDDLVLALAIAAWLGENYPEPFTGDVVLNPWSPETALASRNMEIARQRLVAGDKAGAQAAALAVFRTPGVMESMSAEARSILESLGVHPPEAEDGSLLPAPPMDDDLIRTRYGDVVDFRERWNPFER